MSGMNSLPRREIETAVSHVFRVALPDLHNKARGKAPVALARQAAMYIAHVGIGMTMSDVGLLFSRDRTTVSHACALIEDKRDEPSFDYALQCLEGIVRHYISAHSGSASADPR